MAHAKGVSMQITREMKAERLAELEDLVAKQQVIIFTNYQGLKAKEVDLARLAVEPSDAKLLVTKNTLLRIALKNANLPFETTAFDQPLACIFGLTDQVTTAKAVVKATKDLEAFEILGGIVDGQLVDEAAIRNLATLPSREELLGKLVGTIAAPMSGFVSVLSGNMRGLVQVLHQYEEKQAQA
jgi:large subunit ribosomal protein L10